MLTYSYSTDNIFYTGEHETESEAIEAAKINDPESRFIWIATNSDDNKHHTNKIYVVFGVNNEFY